MLSRSNWKEKNMSKGLAVEEPVGADLKLQVRRIIKARRERVFDAWTRPELLRTWFAPGNMIVPGATVDLRTGGDYRIQVKGSMADCEGRAEDSDMSHTAVISGVYKEIIANELLRFTWRGDWDSTEETLVTVEFKDVEGGTEVTLTHEHFATDDSMGKHEHGWNRSLAKLANVCES